MKSHTASHLMAAFAPLALAGASQSPYEAYKVSGLGDTVGDQPDSGYAYLEGDGGALQCYPDYQTPDLPPTETYQLGDGPAAALVKAVVAAVQLDDTDDLAALFCDAGWPLLGRVLGCDDAPQPTNPACGSNGDCRSQGYGYCVWTSYPSAPGEDAGGCCFGGE